MESAAHFLHVSDCISLAGVSPRARVVPSIARMLGALHSAFTCDPQLDYLFEYCQICRAPFEHATVLQLAERLIAHSIMLREPSLTTWAEYIIANNGGQVLFSDRYDYDGRIYLDRSADDAKSPLERALFIIETCEVILGTRKRPISYKEGSLVLPMSLIARGLGQPAHYEYVDTIAQHDYVHYDRHVEDIFRAFALCPRNKRACGEWLECWFAGNVRRACAIFPFAPETIARIMHRMPPSAQSAGDYLITATIGPQLARALIQIDRTRDLLAQSSSNSEDFARCLDIVRARCVRIKTDEDVRGGSHIRHHSLRITKDARILSDELCGAAKNPDPLIFTRVLSVIREFECDEISYKLHWGYVNEDVAQLARAIYHLESANFKVLLIDLSDPYYLAPACVYQTLDNAVRLADLVLSRRTAAALCHDVAANMRKFVRAVRIHGPPFARVLRSYYGRSV